MTVHGCPAAMLLAIKDVEGLEETTAILSDGAAVQALAVADDEVARGEGESEEQLTAAMRHHRRA